MQIFDCGGLWPTADGIHFPLVHLHAILGDDVSEEEDGVAVELTVFQLEIEVVFSQFLVDLHHVVAMFGQVPEVDENVDHVDDDKEMEKLPEHLIHEGLEYGG